MPQTTLIIGGCRSGKSSHALLLAEQIKGRRTFLATCIPYDEEMKERVANHQKERRTDWRTIEAPVDLPGAIEEQSLTSGVVLADCLTLWINNLLMNNMDSETIRSEIERLTRAVQNAACPVILVSNEVGTGIVPENKLARLFRDTAGLVNQKVAAVTSNVIWMVAGIPVKIKG